jgi:hypothetical protein
VYNLGAVKVTWERDEDTAEGYMERVDPVRLEGLLRAGAQILEQGPPDFWGEISWVRYAVPRVTKNQPKIEPVRVTELRWSPEARSLEEANFVAHRKLVSADYLRKNSVSKGGAYDDAAVERAVERGKDDGLKITDLEGEMNSELLDFRNAGADDPARQLHELYECFVKLDVNGDGLLEDAIVTMAGDEILRIEENPWGRVPIFTVSPIRDPHKVIADLSFAEIIGELQGLKIALLRQLLISTANTNNQRFFVDESRVVVSDLIEGRQFIRVTPGGSPDAAGSIVPFPQAGIAPWTMNLLEYLEMAGEEWTGKTRYNQGMDSKSLNKTATGISLLTQASEQRIDYIVRVFAETGVGELLRFLVRLDQMYVDQAQVVRLNNTFLEVTPDDLQGDFDIDVNTEAGIGKRKQTIANLQLYLSLIAPTGMQIGAVTPAEWAKAAQKLLLESGIRNPEEYVKDPVQIQQEMALMILQSLAGGGVSNGQPAQPGAGSGAPGRVEPGAAGGFGA